MRAAGITFNVPIQTDVILGGKLTERQKYLNDVRTIRLRECGRDGGKRVFAGTRPACD